MPQKHMHKKHGRDPQIDMINKYMVRTKHLEHIPLDADDSRVRQILADNAGIKDESAQDKVIMQLNNGVTYKLRFPLVSIVRRDLYTLERLIVTAQQIIKGPYAKSWWNITTGVVLWSHGLHDDKARVSAIVNDGHTHDEGIRDAFVLGHPDVVSAVQFTNMYQPMARVRPQWYKIYPGRY